MSINKKYRYPGLLSFTESQHDIFFGRTEDKERLVSLIFLEKLIVLFGKSGYGKSSLINAGVIPSLNDESRSGKRQYIPVLVRFNTYESDNHTDWFQRFTFHINQSALLALPNRDFLPDTIWGKLKQLQSDKNQVFVLIFDQFEEFFTFPQDQQTAFKSQLADLLYSDIPAYVEQNETRHNANEVEFMSEKIEAKVVFSLRSDRLSLLDDMKDKLPVILHKRYELKSLSQDKAKEALVQPAKIYGNFESKPFDWTNEALNRILNELSHDKRGREVGIEPFQLQILAQSIEQQVIQGKISDRDANGTPDIFPEDLPGDLSNIYADYYQKIIAKNPQARFLIEDGLVFTEKQGEPRRLSMDKDVLMQRYNVENSILEDLALND